MRHLSLQSVGVVTRTQTYAESSTFQLRSVASGKSCAPTRQGAPTKPPRKAARSRINDADIAAESTELSKAQVLNQAAQAMLAQANKAQQSILQLLN